MIDREFADMMLRNFPSARIGSGGKEIIMRCPVCGDSPNPKAAHFYVSLGYDDKPFLYHCFKATCDAKGIVDRATLLKWGVRDTEGLIHVAQRNKNVLKLSKNRKYDDEYIYTLLNDYVFDHPYSYKKLEYINKRLGQALTFKDLIDLKIVLNLKDLLVRNNINNFTRDVKIIEELNLSFIGFITHDNAYVALRNLREGKTIKPVDGRWAKYNIFGKYTDNKSYYIIPTKLDLLRRDRLKIHIAEGQFDILSIYFNLMKKEYGLYAAISGAGYFNICQYLIENKGLFYSEIHIYKDKDVPWHKMDAIAKYVKQFNIPLYVHENQMQGEKDYGVPIDRIIDNYVKL